MSETWTIGTCYRQSSVSMSPCNWLHLHSTNNHLKIIPLCNWIWFYSTQSVIECHWWIITMVLVKTFTTHIIENQICRFQWHMVKHQPNYPSTVVLNYLVCIHITVKTCCDSDSFTLYPLNYTTSILNEVNGCLCRLLSSSYIDGWGPDQCRTSINFYWRAYLYKGICKLNIWLWHHPSSNLLMDPIHI